MLGDKNKQIILEKRISKTMENLEKHNMKAFCAKNKAEALEIIRGLLKEGDTVACGGSMTLDECKVIDLLRNGSYHFLDRNIPGLSPEQNKKLAREAFSSDAYLMSANAITENGELYNVDGNANRVAALTFGPDSVIVLAGYNKIVPDIPAAVERVKKIAAPMNAVRLACLTPCTKTGECMNCSAANRICCTYVLTAQQRQKDRIKVILVEEELGY